MQVEIPVPDNKRIILDGNEAYPKVGMICEVAPHHCPMGARPGMRIRKWIAMHTWAPPHCKTNRHKEEEPEHKRCVVLKPCSYLPAV